MRCHRCGSMMVYEKFYGTQEYFWGWRCIICGEIIDQVIIDNRNARSQRDEKYKEIEMGDCVAIGET